MGWDQLIDLQKQILLNCDWNSTQFCITPFRFNHNAYNWEQIKFHLQDTHNNASLNVQLLQKKFFLKPSLESTLFQQLGNRN